MDYGWIQFESRDDVKDLLVNTATQPIIIEGKAVTIEKFKTWGEREREGGTKTL
jgi:hypothetical protein